MADFDPPFGQDGDRRLPTNTEREQGFLCGPADRKLFTGEFWRIESEIGEVIKHAGLEQTDDRFTQLREAIEAMIAAATGGGTADDYLLMTQARSRLPFFPEVLTSDGKIVVTSPETGKVRIPGGVTLQHRGIYRVTTTQTDFVTAASKTYHLRWTPADGFALKDLADGTYNPATAAEANAAFDSTYDNMLVARVVVNSSNVPAVTNLANKHRLASNGIIDGTDGMLIRSNGASFRFQKVLNWARSPDRVAFHEIKAGGPDGGGHDTDFNIFDPSLPRSTHAQVSANPASLPLTRYGLDAIVGRDAAGEIHMYLSCGA